MVSAGLTRSERLVGTLIAERFECQGLAGAGGMGQVYRALDRTTGELCALKVLPPDGDPARFEREALALSSIDHPGVVHYVAHGVTQDGARYIAMEWLAGVDLAKHLEAGPLTVAETLLVAEQTAEALRAAHERGIVHRDLKPANLFLVDGRLDAVKLLDFGIARSLESSPMTLSGVLIGTPLYMAPEQVRGGSIDARTDVYGVGAVMFRCLTGHPPFVGDHQLAVLAKIVLDPAPSLRGLRPEAPVALEALLARVLAKEPGERPADGMALAEALRGLAGAPAPALAAVTERERRVASLVLCARAIDEETTLPGHGGIARDDVLHRVIEERGGVIDALARGAWVVTIPDAASPAEQGLRAARCALALSAIRPGAPVVVATGHVLVDGLRRVGEVIDRAAQALAQAPSIPGVRLDAATAELLDARFRVEGQGSWRVLIAEDDAIAPARMLLGKPAPCVGREPQLAMLGAVLQASVDESRAGAALLVSPPGVGKTRLLHEFLRTAASERDLDILLACGEPMRSASPYGIAEQLLRRAAGALASDSPSSRAAKLASFVTQQFEASDAPRMIEFLGEICGIPTASQDASPALRAARQEPSLMADAVREAWIDWIMRRAALRPVLLVVDDLHWADAASVGLIEAGLRAGEARPIFFLGAARSGPASSLSERLRARGLVEVSLPPLSGPASERLVRGALGAGADDALVRSLSKRSAGHPFHLEELVRAVATGQGAGALPDSVLGMVQARFDDLDTRTRRLLRAGSVFGETFWSGGVRALVGDDLSPRQAGEVLETLVDREVITEQRPSRWRGESEYRFRHALLRDGAYATLAEPDRVRAHKRAGEWLEAMGEGDPVVLGEHYDLGATSDRAAAQFRRAATLALRRNDLDHAMVHAKRARALEPNATGEAVLSAVEAEVLYWRGDLEAAAQRASDATRQLPRGTHEWLDAVSVAIGALGQLGRNEAVAELLQELGHAESTPHSRGAHVVALCRAMAQLFWAHHGGALPEVRMRLDALVEHGEPLDPYHSGWVHRVRGESAWLHARNVERCLAELDASCEAFDRAHAVRALCLTRLNAASLAGWSGDPSRGLELIARSRVEAEHLGSDFLLRYGQTVEGLLLAYADDARAEEVMRDAAARVSSSPRLAYISSIVVGSIALDRGDVDEGSARAAQAASYLVAAELRPAALALAARVAFAREHVDDAVRLASEAVRLESAGRDLELTSGMASVALAEVLADRDPDAARAALEPALRLVDAIAATIPSPAQRANFRQRPLSNRSAMRLAARLGVG